MGESVGMRVARRRRSNMKKVSGLPIEPADAVAECQAEADDHPQRC